MANLVKDLGFWCGAKNLENEGIRSQSRPAAVMHSIYRVLETCNFEWHTVGLYHLLARPKNDQFANLVRLPTVSIQVYRLTNQRAGYVIDFRNIGPPDSVIQETDEMDMKMRNSASGTGVSERRATFDSGCSSESPSFLRCWTSPGPLKINRRKWTFTPDKSRSYILSPDQNGSMPKIIPEFQAVDSGIVEEEKTEPEKSLHTDQTAVQGIEVAHAASAPSMALNQRRKTSVENQKLQLHGKVSADDTHRLLRAFRLTSLSEDEEEGLEELGALTLNDHHDRMGVNLPGKQQETDRIEEQDLNNFPPPSHTVRYLDGCANLIATMVAKSR